MDRSTHVTLGGLLTGLVIGFGAGVLFQMVRAAWRGHAALQDAASAAGRVKWRLTGQHVVLVFLLAVAAAATLGGLYEGRR